MYLALPALSRHSCCSAPPFPHCSTPRAANAFQPWERDLKNPGLAVPMPGPWSWWRRLALFEDGASLCKAELRLRVAALGAILFAFFSPWVRAILPTLGHKHGPTHPRALLHQGICSPLSVSSGARYHRESSPPAPTSLISTTSEAGLGKAGASIPPCQGCERLGAEPQPEPWKCSHPLRAGAPLLPVWEQTPKRSPHSSPRGSAAFEDGLKPQSATLPRLA